MEFPMRMDWKGVIVAFIVVSAVAAFTVGAAFAVQGGSAGGMGGAAGGAAGGAGGGVQTTGGAEKPMTSGTGQKAGTGVQTTGGGKQPTGMTGAGQKTGTGVQTTGGAKPQTGMGGAGQKVGTGVQTGAGQKTGMGEKVGQGTKTGGQVAGGQKGGFEGRSFDRNSFFGAQGHDGWIHSHKHHYWNGNAWVFGIPPAGFVAVPVPVSSCPYSPERFGGSPDACFFSCVDGGYDPINVCNICCGTNY